MSPQLPSFAYVCSTIQREEVRKKVMNVEPKSTLSDTRAYAANRLPKGEISYKGKRPDLKCQHCHHLGHLVERCWVFHPELKPKFSKDKGPPKHRTHVAETLQGDMVNYTSNPISLINEFATYLQQKGDQGLLGSGNSNSTALFGKFAGFLANSQHQSHENIEGFGGYSYFWEPWWWAGMITMIVGEKANFAAYAYALAILVTPLGALSIIFSAVLAHFILEEKLHIFGVVGCALCLVGSTTVVLHAPQERKIESVKEVWHLATEPGKWSLSLIDL
ncbi:uncharacterized protein LOC127800483 isoform X2 [Diospyros lotus]|uniref:uncharacterized protein LOC127800483 isoform X2 n=1 Tax=Diospyros lotus TaxID=55363 RepID=UPI00224EDF22|nr:uncharacterized protein LOC127800483 isoform X2 [Diospyros lotus]